MKIERSENEMDQQGVPVYLRDADDSERHFLGRFAADDLDGLVKTINNWGCFQGDDAKTDAFAQFFVAADDRVTAGFEIVVGAA